MTLLWSVFCHPLWALVAVLLGIVVRAQRRGAWDPRLCRVHLDGKTAIVTGANSGIGKFIAMDFARRGARVILACRSQERGNAALEEIRKQTGNSNVHLRLLDTSSLDSVRTFAEKFMAEETALHILVNNAGVSGLPMGITKDGLEASFATNHLGPFLFTNLLLDLMKRSAPARIVNVNSTIHRKGKVDFSHFRGENLTHRMHNIYCNTKLHSLICTNELARRLQGSGVTANSVHPGIVMTTIIRHYHFSIRLFFKMIGTFFFKSAEEGARSTIYCALAEEMEGITGKYVDSDCSLALPAPQAQDPALAVKDFEFSERVTSVDSLGEI